MALVLGHYGKLLRKKWPTTAAAISSWSPTGQIVVSDEFFHCSALENQLLNMAWMYRCSGCHL